MNKYQEALDNIDKCRVNKTLNINIKDILILQELVDLHKKIRKDVEFLNSQDIRIFILPDGKEILGYNITECPSRIVLAESIRENIEKILKCFNRGGNSD